ncbi:MAG: Beta-galactosidase [Defluviitaleaceae bacterium]|nr:Beta-galactosidase [Defluviitaleaceae bacterium]
MEVKPIKPESKVKRLIIDNNNFTLDPGDTAEFTVTAEYLDGHTEDVTNRATYENPNPAIAEVSNGTITAKLSGLVTVAVSFKGDLGDTATAQISVTVSGQGTEEGLKPFTMITDGKLVRANGILAEIQVSPTGGVVAHDGEEVVVFQLMKGNTPVSIPVLMRDITSTESMKVYFNVESDDPSYTVKVFILDRFSSDDTAPVSLAEPVILK